MKDNIIQRLEALRQAMRTRGIDLTIIPHVDPHQSEYMADHWHLREYLSGFNGSAGTLVVSLDDAKLWTDSRYFLQAAQQLDETGITLMKDGLAITPSITDYIRTTLPSGSTVGIDGMLFSINSERDLKEKLGEVGINLVTDFTPADEVWANRPPLPSDKAFIHDMKYAGESTRDKIGKILARVKEAGADAILISALDEIAWALNLRGKDVAYNPVVTSFLYLGKTGSTLFIDDVKVTDSVREYLAGNDISIAPYNSVLKFASALPLTTKVLVDPGLSSSALVTALGKRILLGRSPIPLLKGIRNDVQIEGLHRAMLRDGIALVRSFMEIEETLSQGKRLTETGVCKILTRNRSLQPDYFDDSFGTIAGYKGHGAIVHYEPTEESDAEIYPDGLLLADSGAQYLDGTTDITRTVSLGNPTADERHDFTLVLKGCIALASAVFPEGTCGVQLDILAHQYLWKEGKTYLHGTGHGVGSFLNVHEGPQSFRNRIDHLTTVPFAPGMVTSDEPGLYVTDKYGIRCENMILTVVDRETEFGRFLRFDTVTLFPFDINLIETSMFNDDEIKWINEYHKKVYDLLTPSLNEKETAWLAAKTQPISRK